ncbi:MAG: RIO1 family regulatory kinase/ATPase [archaeon]
MEKIIQQSVRRGKSTNVLSQGAEAVLIRKDDLVLKRRVAKGYRLKEMDDKIRKLRTRREGKLLERSGKLISVPVVTGVDEKKGEIDMEFVEGLKLSEELDGLENWREVCLVIGKNIAKLHDADIIHGDLTTSNMILVDEELGASRLIDGARVARKLSDKSRSELRGSAVDDRKSGGGCIVYFIDFGLGFSSSRIEDKTVDLHLIKQALEAKHYNIWERCFDAILKGYGESGNYDKVMKQFEKVERRGRYKRSFS